MSNKVSKDLSINDLNNIPLDVYKELSLPKNIQKYTNICNIIKEHGGSCDTNAIILSLFNKHKEKVKRVALQKTLAIMRKNGYIELTETKGVYRLIKK